MPQFINFRDVRLSLEHIVAYELSLVGDYEEFCESGIVVHLSTGKMLLIPIPADADEDNVLSIDEHLAFIKDELKFLDLTIQEATERPIVTDFDVEFTARGNCE